MREYLLWCNGMGNISAMPGQRFNPQTQEWVKESALPELWCRSQLWLRSELWPSNSICHGVAKKEKKKKRKTKQKADMHLNFILFLWMHHCHMEVSRLGVESELKLRPTLQPG